MKTLKRNMQTEASRKFWAQFPKRKPGKVYGPLPSIGEAWWEAEKELSLSLLHGGQDDKSREK